MCIGTRKKGGECVCVLEGRRRIYLSKVESKLGPEEWDLVSKVDPGEWELIFARFIFRKIEPGNWGLIFARQ